MANDGMEDLSLIIMTRPSGNIATWMGDNEEEIMRDRAIDG